MSLANIHRVSARDGITSAFQAPKKSSETVSNRRGHRLDNVSSRSLGYVPNLSLAERVRKEGIFKVVAQIQARIGPKVRK